MLYIVGSIVIKFGPGLNFMALLYRYVPQKSALYGGTVSSVFCAERCIKPCHFVIITYDSIVYTKQHIHSSVFDCTPPIARLVYLPTLDVFSSIYLGVSSTACVFNGAHNTSIISINHTCISLIALPICHIVAHCIHCRRLISECSTSLESHYQPLQV